MAAAAAQGRPRVRERLRIGAFNSALLPEPRQNPNRLVVITRGISRLLEQRETLCTADERERDGDPQFDVLGVSYT